MSQPEPPPSDPPPDDGELPLRLDPPWIAYAWPYLLVVGLAAIGLLTVALDHFRRGTVLFSVAVCLGAVLRAVLPQRAVGMLRVRSRLIDVACLATVGGAALVLSLAVPSPA